MILRWPPDPADVPPDPRRLLRGGAEVDFLDEAAIGVGDDQAHLWVAADQHSDGGCRQLTGVVMGMPLTAIFQPHCLKQWHTEAAACCRQASCLGSARV